MSRHYRRISRDYRKPFFSRRRNNLRTVVIVLLAQIIIALPLFTWWQYDRVQLYALDQIGYAPTATPFASFYAQRGQQNYIAGDVEAAAADYRQAAIQQPENINYLFEYGKVIIDLGRSPEASEIADQIIVLAPDDPRGYALKAYANAAENPTEAIPMALEGLARDDQFSLLHSALAVAYTSVFRYAEGLRHGDLAIRLDPMDATARRSYSFPLILTGNYSEAVRQLEQAIAINPNLTAPYFELASLYRNPAINRPEYAVNIFKEIIQIEPENEKAYLRICETYAAAGLLRDAEPFCLTALDLNPVYADAHRMLGQLRYGRRNYEGAIEEFNICLDLSLGANRDVESDYSQAPIECVYLMGLANYLLGQDNCEAAWFFLNEALNHPGAVENVEELILEGLSNTTRDCPGYRGRSLPTPLPPTPIPPTPIGGY